MHRFGLRDDQWDWIKDLLPGRPGARPLARQGDLLWPATTSRGHPTSPGRATEHLRLWIYYVLCRGDRWLGNRRGAGRP